MRPFFFGPISWHDLGGARASRFVKVTLVPISLRLEALESQEALSGKIADAISGMQEVRKILQGLGKEVKAESVKDCLAKAT